MQHKADTYRGMIIGFSTSLENKINQFISEYFVSDGQKRNDFVAVFFSTTGLNFRHKRKILNHIIKTDNRFNLFLASNPNFITNLDNIVSNRNDMAHSTLHSTKDNIDKFNGDNFQLHCYKPDNQKIFKEKTIDVDFRKLQTETDSILAINIKINDLIKCANP